MNATISGQQCLPEESDVDNELCMKATISDQPLGKATFSEQDTDVDSDDQVRCCFSDGDDDDDDDECLSLSAIVGRPRMGRRMGVFNGRRARARIALECRGRGRANTSEGEPVSRPNAPKDDEGSDVPCKTPRHSRWLRRRSTRRQSIFLRAIKIAERARAEPVRPMDAQTQKKKVRFGKEQILY